MMVSGFERDNVLAVAFVPDDNMVELESFKDVFDMVLTDEESFELLLKDLQSVLDK